MPCPVVHHHAQLCQCTVNNRHPNILRGSSGQPKHRACFTNQPLPLAITLNHKIMAYNCENSAHCSDAAAQAMNFAVATKLAEVWTASKCMTAHCWMIASHTPSSSPACCTIRMSHILVCTTACMLLADVACAHGTAHAVGMWAQTARDAAATDAVHALRNVHGSVLVCSHSNKRLASASARTRWWVHQ